MFQKLLYWLSKPIVLSYTGTALKMNVQRQEPLPAGAKIIAANHPSTTDPFFVASMLRMQSFILINNLLFQVPFLGEYLRRSGHIPVIAGGGQKAIDEALRHLALGGLAFRTRVLALPAWPCSAAHRLSRLAFTCCATAVTPSVPRSRAMTSTGAGISTDRTMSPLDDRCTSAATWKIGRMCAR